MLGDDFAFEMEGLTEKEQRDLAEELGIPFEQLRMTPKGADL